MAYPTPTINPTVRIAQGAVIIGDVTIGPESLVLFNAVLRGDCGRKIVIGEQTNIQDGTVVHVAYDADTIVGDRVTIGHNAVIHGCVIEDECIIGMGATVMDGAHVPPHCIVGANALVTSSLSCPEGSLIIGAPARATRALTERDLETIQMSWKDYLALGDELAEAGLLQEC